MALICRAFGNFLPCPARPGEAASMRPCNAVTHINPQHSFVRHRILRNLAKITGVSYLLSAKEGWSCICKAIASRAVCPNGSRLEPLMLSRAGAIRKGNCVFSPATWSCPAASASILLRIRARRQRCGTVVSARAARGQSRKAQPAVLENGPAGRLKKLWQPPEQPARATVDIASAGRSPPAPHPQSPGVEPRPL
jgi:hypothetical protein